MLMSLNKGECICTGNYVVTGRQKQQVGNRTRNYYLSYDHNSSLLVIMILVIAQCPDRWTGERIPADRMEGRVRWPTVHALFMMSRCGRL